MFIVPKENLNDILECLDEEYVPEFLTYLGIGTSFVPLSVAFQISMSSNGETKNVLNHALQRVETCVIGGEAFRNVPVELIESFGVALGVHSLEGDPNPFLEAAEKDENLCEIARRAQLRIYIYRSHRYAVIARYAERVPKDGDLSLVDMLEEVEVAVKALFELCPADKYLKLTKPFGLKQGSDNINLDRIAELLGKESAPYIGKLFKYLTHDTLYDAALKSMNLCVSQLILSRVGWLKFKKQVSV